MKMELVNPKENVTKKDLASLQTVFATTLPTRLANGAILMTKPAIQVVRRMITVAMD